MSDQPSSPSHEQSPMKGSRFHPLWVAWVNQPWRWVPTLTLIPVLYGLGWLVMQPVARLIPGLTISARDLMGTLVSELLFIVVLPSWVRLRWTTRQPWRQLGLSSSRQQPPRRQAFTTGLAWAFGLLLVISVISLSGRWAYWLGDLNASEVLNALLLCFGVGLAEELLFRGWLWGELTLFMDARSAFVGQAAVFSLVHTRFNLGVWPMLGLLTGLFGLGLVLGLRRRLDQGSLWGCIGLHGGLVGGWFLLHQAGLLQWSPQTPFWLSGPGGNPLGGVVGIAAVTGLLILQLTALAKAARP